MKPRGITWEEYKVLLKPDAQNEYASQEQDKAASDVYVQYDETNCACDVVYIVALQDEFEHLLNAYSIDASNYIERSGLKFVVFRHSFTPEMSLWIAIIKPCGKGLTSAAMCTTQALLLLKPKLVIMTGICATPTGKADFGDILIFESVYLHDEGKLTPQGMHPDIIPITLSRKASDICDKVISSQGVLEKISKKWPEGLTRREPLIAKKVLAASGSAVIADSKYLQQILAHNRNLSAVDMEAYAIAYCSTYVGEGCDWLVVKGVQDNGNEEKKDTYRHYASFTSAMYSLHLVKEFFSNNYM